MKYVIRSVLFTTAVVSAIYFCIRYPQEIGGAVSECIFRCINVIIPSMFIFMCLTSAAVRAGLHSFAGIPFAFPARYLFRLRSDSFGIFILSMFSGYPAGIKLLTDCLRRNEITAEEFDRLSCFCFAAGPAFISGIVSGIIFPGTSAGLLCFISVTAGNIAAALVSGFFSSLPDKRTRRPEINISADCIIEGVLSSARAIFQMCVMITAFGGIFKAAELSGAVAHLSGFLTAVTGLDNSCTKTVISSFFEISNIAYMPQSISLLPVISALLSFGGVCVLIQVIVISDGLLDIKRFLVSRLFAAASAALCCRLISRFFDLGTVTVFAHKTFYSDRDIIPAVFLLVMTIMLLSLSKSYGQSDKKVI